MGELKPNRAELPALEQRGFTSDAGATMSATEARALIDAPGTESGPVTTAKNV